MTPRSKSDDNYEEGSFRASKTMTVTRMATRRGPIPVTVDAFEGFGGGGNAERGRIKTLISLNPYFPPVSMFFSIILVYPLYSLSLTK